MAQITGRQQRTDKWSVRSRSMGVWVLAALLASACGTRAVAQSQDKPKGDSHITEQQAQQLFALVDELIKFSSDESGLAIKTPVKRQLTTRDAVESYLSKKFDEDQDAKRMQRDEVVLKKFGLAGSRLRVEAISAGAVERADRSVLRLQDQDREHA